MAPLPHPSPTQGQKPQAVLARLSSSSETIGSGSPRTHQHPGPALALPLASLAACCSHRAVTHGCLQPHCGPEHAHPSQRCSPQHVPPSARHSGTASRPRWQHPVCRITPVLAFLPPLSQCVPASSPRCVTLSCLCPSRTGGLAHAEAPRDHLWMCPRCLLSHGQEQTALCLHPRVWQPELAQPERFGDGAHSTGGVPLFPALCSCSHLALSTLRCLARSISKETQDQPPLCLPALLPPEQGFGTVPPRDPAG